MIICGLKLTHDGSVSLIDNGKLIFCIEMEKLNNNPRYSEIENLSIVPSILKDYGYSLDQIDNFVIDGWGGYDSEAVAIQPRLDIGEEFNTLSAFSDNISFKLPIAQYHERTLNHDILERWNFNGLKMSGKDYSYSSYLHVTGHVLSAYCSSPFSAKKENLYVLVWDGGMYPRLYYINGLTGKIENRGPIFLLIGNIYTIFSQHFGPFKVKGPFAKDDLSIAGKVMAYIGLGKVNEELFPYFETIYQENYDKPMGFANVFANKFKEAIKGKGYSDENILATFHVFLEKLLIEKLDKKIKRYNDITKNLCFVGGCALNIKWNSAIRRSKIFEKIYIPPFPNDSGSAIGVACAEMVKLTGNMELKWDVYSGPMVIKNEPETGWVSKDCSVKDLAILLFETNEPIVCLNGRAELGPRALGNRSIIASATSIKMKDILNFVKNRESYRPVSPICLENKAVGIFDPGTPDPYMLFDHSVRPGWNEKIPAICHVDGTARLQTINSENNLFFANLLIEYERLCGIPLLCNTSANHNGSGFFPDVKSVLKWNKVNYVWCNDTLFERLEKIDFNII